MIYVKKDFGRRQMCQLFVAVLSFGFGSPLFFMLQVIAQAVSTVKW